MTQSNLSNENAFIFVADPFQYSTKRVEKRKNIQVYHKVEIDYHLSFLRSTISLSFEKKHLIYLIHTVYGYCVFIATVSNQVCHLLYFYYIFIL